MFQNTINPGGVSFILISTSTTLTIDYATGGLTAAFTGAGTDGEITVTLPDNGDTNFAVFCQAASATAAFAAGVIAKTGTTAVINISDLATPTDVDLTSVDTTLDVVIVRR